MNKLKNILLVPVILLAACVHRPDIEQGNILTPTQLGQLHKGMTMDEVKALLGSPMLHVPLNPNRLEYVYTFQKGHDVGTGQRLSLLFKNQKLVTIQHEKSFTLPD